MADADFTLKLVDMMTGPARRAAASANALVERLKATEAAAKEAGKGAQHLQKLEAATNKAATAAERLAVAEARAGQVTAAAAAKAATARSKSAAAYQKEASAIKQTLLAQQHATASKRWNAGVAARQAAAPTQQAAAGGGMSSMMASFGGNVMASALGKVVSIIGQMVAAIGRAAVTFGGMVANAALFADRQKTSLGILLKSSAAGDAAYKSAVKLATDYGLAVEDTVNQYSRLIKQGFTAGQADDLVKMAADMKALGATSDEVSRTFEAIGKIKATGYLQGDELNPLIEAGLNAGKLYEALAKRLGKTVDEVKKLKEAGKITAEDAIAAIQEATMATAGTSKLGDAAAKMAKTLSGSWDRFKSKAEATLLSIGEKLIPKLVDKAVPMLDKLMAWADSPAGAKFVDDIVAGFGGLVDMLGEIDVDDVTSAVEDIGEAFKSVKSAVEATIIVVKALGYIPGIAVIIASFKLLLSIVEAVNKAIDKLKGGEGNDMGAGGLTKGTMPDILDESGLAASMSAGGKAAGTSLVQGIIDGIMGGLGAVAQAAMAVSQSAISASQSSLDAHSPSRVFRDLYASVPAGAVEGITDGSPRVQSAAANMISSASVGGTRTTTANVRTHAPVNITIPAAADPQATAAIVAATLESRLAGIFQDLSLQVGVIGTGAPA